MLNYVAIDTETALITAGNLTPALTCVSFDKGDGPWLLNQSLGALQVKQYLLSDWHIIGHNIAYDLAVIKNEYPKLEPLIWKAYDEGRIHDTKIREQLNDIESGLLGSHGYSLSDLSERYLGVHLNKSGEGPRLKYGPLREIPIDKWPPDAIDYAKDDAKATLAVFNKQVGPNLADEAAQCRAAWALHLMSVRGVITNEKAVLALANQLQEKYDALQSELKTVGFFQLGGTKKAPKWTKNLTAVRNRVRSIFGTSSPQTGTGRVATDADTLTQTQDPLLKKLVEFSGTEKLLKTYVPVLVFGTRTAINARFNVLVASGRTSCSRPNLQNLPRTGGLRECFVPRPGFVFISADYDTIEMRCLAQIHLWMFGKSAMAEVLRSGKDLHLEVASRLLQWSYEETFEKRGTAEVKNARQAAKVANYGFSGDMQASTLVDFARAQYHINLSSRLAFELYEAFFSAWPEMVPYLRHAELTARRDKQLTQFVSKRIRGRIGKRDCANSWFQGLAADGAKAACYVVTTECALDETSPLYQSYPVVFLHDQIICETPIDCASAAAKRLGDIMCREMARFVPEVPITAEGVVFGDRWVK